MECGCGQSHFLNLFVVCNGLNRTIALSFMDGNIFRRTIPGAINLRPYGSAANAAELKERLRRSLGDLKVNQAARAPMPGPGDDSRRELANLALTMV